MKNILVKALLLLALICLSDSIFSQNYKRIVSLASSLTMNIYYLEAKDKLVGCTSYCDEAKKDKKEVVATAVKVNLEKVLSLKPDLVIATTITNPETVESLRKFGIKVQVFPTAKSFEEICSQFALLGKLIGKEKLASSVISKSKSRIAALRKSIGKVASPNVFFQIGSKPLFAVIPNTFMNDYITFVGGKNIAYDLKKGSITRESVLMRNPDVIFIVTMGMIGGEEKKNWEAYKELKAVKNKKIFIIDSGIACTPTPVSFVKTFETIVKLLYNK